MPQVSVSTNPRGILSDRIPTFIKAAFKNNKFPWFFGNRRKKDHMSIISDPVVNGAGTQKSGAVILSALPTASRLDQLSKERKMARVTFLTADEEKDMGYPKNDSAHTTFYIPLLDHGVIDANTGLNIAYDEFKNRMRELKEYAERNPDTDLYFHCMAGKSRSQIGAIGYRYLNGLDDNKLPSEIAAEVRKRRPKAKALERMDGDQAGFLGLLVLHKEAGSPSPILGRAGIGAVRDVEVAQNIGLMLRAPLDCGFRDKSDVEAQETAFIKMYEHYKDAGMNLLSSMLIPITTTKRTTSQEQYIADFKALSPGAKAHFAILVNRLQKAGKLDTKDLPKGYGSPKDCAVEVLDDIKKLSAGDLVELLREFGSEEKFKDAGVLEYAINKIVTGTKTDGYHAGTQLAELWDIAKKNGANEKTLEAIDQASYKLNKKEQESYTSKVHEILEAGKKLWKYVTVRSQLMQSSVTQSPQPKHTALLMGNHRSEKPEQRPRAMPK